MEETNKSISNKKPKSQKLVIIGDSNVGKTSIIDQFIENKFGDTKPSIGALHKLKTIKNSQNDDVQLDIWDTAGQEKFKSIVPMYYKGAKGIIIVFDLTNKDSFEGAKKWIHDVENNNNGAFLILVGNKLDLDNRQVSSDQAINYTNSKNIHYIETSAKTGENLEEVFKMAADKIQKSNEVNNSSKLTINISPQESKVNYCCYSY
jgi:small GTP-binding protein